LELRYFLQHYPALVAQATGGLKRELARLLKPTLLVVDDLAISRSTSSPPTVCSR
jgi:hypothetical protein